MLFEALKQTPVLFSDREAMQVTYLFVCVHIILPKNFSQTKGGQEKLAKISHLY